MTRMTVAEARKLGLIPGAGKKKRVVQLSQVQWDAKKTPNGIWIQIPFVPPSLNVWKNWHWAKQQRYKKDLTADLARLAMAMVLPCYHRASVDITYYFKTNRRRDPQDNYAPKFLMDALVGAGILDDDNGELVKVKTPEIMVDRERPRTEVFIWDMWINHGSDR